MTGKHILIIDDQRLSVQLLADLLAAQGISSSSAFDGAEGVRLARELLPDAILLDLVMPGMSGVETCLRLKENPLTACIPVLAVTGYSNDEHLVQAFQAGVDDFLRKPVAGHELAARLRSALDKRNAMELLERKMRKTELLLDISSALTSTLDASEILQIIVDCIASEIPVKRCSMARINEREGFGVILASSDDPAIKGFRIDLARYPEIREVARTGHPLFVADAFNHPLFHDMREQITSLGFSNILVLPVIYACEVIGTLMLRTAGDRSFSSDDVQFCQLVANVSVGAIKNAFLYEQACSESLQLRDAKCRLEQELREKAIFESLFQNASEGQLVLNVRGEAVYINQGGLDLLGFTHDDLPSPLFPHVVAEESRAEAMKIHADFFTGLEFPQGFDLFIRRRNGDRRCIALSMSDHKLMGMYAIISFRDVTDERSWRVSLEEANLRLRELDRLKSNFINTATHELSIPVTVLNGYCTLIRELGTAHLEPRQREYLESAIQCSDRLVELVEDMLDLSRMEAGKGVFSLSPSCVLEPVERAVALLAPYARTHGIDLRIVPGAGAATALLDADKIQRVLTNLIGNAIKFTPPGGCIEVGAEVVGDEVHLSVTDTGEGIPEAFLPSLFEEFTQLHREGTRKGSGLGLAISRKIVEAHNGRIWVSCSGGGSRFTFSLPASTP